MTDGKIELLDVYTKQVEMKTILESFVFTIQDHEDRLRSLEKWRYSFPAAMLMSIVSVVFTILHAAGVL